MDNIPPEGFSGERIKAELNIRVKCIETNEAVSSGKPVGKGEQVRQMEPAGQLLLSIIEELKTVNKEKQWILSQKQKVKHKSFP